MRCAVVAPKLEHGECAPWSVTRTRAHAPWPDPAAFTHALHREGWDVHTQMAEPEGPALEEFNYEEEDKEAEMLRRLQEVDEHLPKRALILKTSHIGGHKYAGNVIVSLISCFVSEG